VARQGRAGAGRLAIGEAFRPPIGRAAGRRKAEPANGRRTVRVGGVATPAREDEDEDGGAEKRCMRAFGRLARGRDTAGAGARVGGSFGLGCEDSLLGNWAHGWAAARQPRASAPGSE